MKASEITLVLFLGSLFFLNLFFTFRLTYLRYFKTYRKEMNNFLENHHYIFLDSRMPNSDEWANNPFSQDSGLSKNLFRLMFSYSVTNFTLITAKNQELITEFWMSVKTTPFRKPIVTFRQGTSYENTDKYIYKDIKIVQVIDSCPACGFKLNNQDIECPDCGLSFK